MRRGGWVSLALVAVIGLAAGAASFDFYRAGPNGVGLFSNLTGDAVDELVLRFTGPIEPVNAIGIGAEMQLISNVDGELHYSGSVVPNGTWEVDWTWDGPRLDYAAWFRDGVVVEEIPVHNPTAAFGMLGRYSGQRIRFFAPASGDPDGLPLAQYRWQWSDGVTAEGVQVERTLVAGEHWVVLTVRDADGNETSRFARFEISDCKLTVNVTGCGTVNGATVLVIECEYGSEVILDPAACDHWDFIGWEDDLSGEDDPVAIRVLGDTTITAVFSQHPYVVRAHAEGGGRICAEGNAGGHPLYECGDEFTFTAFFDDDLTFTAIPDAHWDFVGWSDGSGAENPHEVTILGNTSIAANFELHNYILTVTSGEGGVVAVTPDNVTVGPGELRTFLHHFGDVVTLDPAAAEHSEFTGWSGDLTGSADPAGIIVEGDMSITANFRGFYLISFQDTGVGSTWDIYVIREDGTDLLNLTQSAAEDKYANWAPNGASIAFISTRNGGTWKPYVVGSDGTGLRLLADKTAVDITWGSSDILAFINAPDNGSGDVWTVHADSSSLTKVTSGLSFYNIAMSRDGSRISGYVPGSGLYAMDADGSDLRRYSTNEGYGIAWSPDSRYIAHIYDDGLYVYDYETGTNRLVTTAAQLGVPYLLGTCNVDWSPSGQELAFEAGQVAGAYDVWTIGIDGSAPRRITTDPQREASDGWSPDGLRLVYVQQASPAGFRVVDVSSGATTFSRPMSASSAWYHTYPVWQGTSL